MSGHTSRPAYWIGRIPLNIIPPQRLAPSSLTYIYAPELTGFRLERFRAGNGLTIEAPIARQHFFLIKFCNRSFAVAAADRAPEVGALGEAVESGRKSGFITSIDDQRPIVGGDDRRNVAD